MIYAKELSISEIIKNMKEGKIVGFKRTSPGIFLDLAVSGHTDTVLVQSDENGVLTILNGGHLTDEIYSFFLNDTPIDATIFGSFPLGGTLNDCEKRYASTLNTLLSVRVCLSVVDPSVDGYLVKCISSAFV